MKHDPMREFADSPRYPQFLKLFAMLETDATKSEILLVANKLMNVSNGEERDRLPDILKAELKKRDGE